MAELLDAATELDERSLEVQDDVHAAASGQGDARGVSPWPRGRRPTCGSLSPRDWPDVSSCETLAPHPEPAMTGKPSPAHPTASAASAAFEQDPDEDPPTQPTAVVDDAAAVDETPLEPTDPSRSALFTIDPAEHWLLASPRALRVLQLHEAPGPSTWQDLAAQALSTPRRAGARRRPRSAARRRHPAPRSPGGAPGRPGDGVARAPRGPLPPRRPRPHRARGGPRRGSDPPEDPRWDLVTSETRDRPIP